MKRLMSRGLRVWLGSLGFVGAGLAALHCSSTDIGSEFPDAGNDPCEVAYKGLCGKPCDVDETCAAGLYCRPLGPGQEVEAGGAKGTCHADCANAPKIQGVCSEGVACSPRGRCGTDPSDASLVDGGSDVKNDGTCAAIDVVVEKIVPTVLLLIDQSSSMEYDFTGANLMPPNFPNSRWVKLRESLMDPDGGIVKKYENDVEFGLALYGANNGNEKPPAVAECPIMKTVAFAKGNHAAIEAVYAPELPIDDTPTPDAVLAAAGLDPAGIPLDGGFAATPTGRPKIIVLATDGEPGRCGSFDSLELTGAPASQQAVVDAVTAAYRAGIKTFVITVGDSVSESHQQKVANAGFGYFPGGADAGPDAQAPLVRTTSQAQLAAAFDSIIFGVRSCSFKLAGSVVPGTEGQGEVKVNGASVTLNSPDGWKLNSPTEIEFVGAACTTIKTSDAKVSVRFPCGSFIPR